MIFKCSPPDSKESEELANVPQECKGSQAGRQSGHLRDQLGCQAHRKIHRCRPRCRVHTHLPYIHQYNGVLSKFSYPPPLEGSVSLLSSALCLVKKVRFFKTACKTNSKFHISIGYTVHSYMHAYIHTYIHTYNPFSTFQVYIQSVLSTSRNYNNCFNCRIIFLRVHVTDLQVLT